MTIIALHFNILEKIGEGSFGTVYRVEDTRTKENFAIKVFDKVPLEEIKEHLSPEMIYKITSLSHRNLIRVYDYGIYDEHLYALLEYFDGQSLKNFRLGYENRDEFLEIIVQTCYALQYLHDNNILHKDLKPENILYTRTNEGIKVKVYDFGFTKVVSQPGGEQDVVTLPYFPPEVLRNSTFSPQSDFYSLGVILYYLAVGAFPFSKDESALMMEKKIPNIIPQFPSRVNPAVSQSIEELIFKLIEFNPMLRFKNAREIIQFINKTHSTSFPVTLKPSPLENIRSKPPHIHPKSILTLNGYVEIATNGNGQIVFITGDYGVGKKSSIRFLKWYLISKGYSTFYYRCNESHRDPIFMLCKELIAMQDKSGEEKFVSGGSEKIQEFLFRSEEKSLDLPEAEKSLATDFLLTKSYIYAAAKIKPIIYFIGDIEMARPSTLEFLQFLEEDIHNYPILIVASTSEAVLANKIKIAVQIRLEPLSKEETLYYIQELLESTVPYEFAEKIYLFTNGNQTFIREILLDLVEKKILSLQDNRWNFYSKENAIRQLADIDKIEPPPLMKNVINKKIQNIPQGIYKYVELLAVAEVPLSNSLVMSLLNLISSKEVFFILTQCEDLEILVKDPEFPEEGYYKFSYPTVKKILASRVSRRERVAVEKKIIKYFEDKNITRDKILNGIIEHCKDVKDDTHFVYYQMKKAHISYKNKNLLEAWETCDIALDKLTSITEKEIAPEKNEKKSSILKFQDDTIKEYLLFFMRLSLILEKGKKALVLYKKYKDLQAMHHIEASEIDLALHLYYPLLLIKCAQFDKAAQEIQSLAKQDFKDKENTIYLCWLILSVYSYRLDKVKQYMNELKTDTLAPRYQLWYLYVGSKYHFSVGEYRQAVAMLKNAEKLVLRVLSTDFLKQIFLGRIYKSLGDMYNTQNLLDRASQYYADAEEISREEGDLITLAGTLTNEGSLLLKKGELENAIVRFEKALENFVRLQYEQGTAEVHLNLAQAHYKLGNFRQSDMHFKKALQVAKAKNLKEEILSRYSFLKLKIEPPARFLSFLKKNFSYFLEQGEIREVNSFLKNYVFFLHEIGKDEKIEDILEYLEEHQIDCSLEREFLLQARGYVRAKQGDTKAALALFRMASHTAKRNQNEYALMIHYFNLAETYLNKGNLRQAEINCELASAIAYKNRFARWQNLARIIEARIQLLNPEINLRIVLRKLLKAEKIAKEMKDWSLLCQSRFLIISVYHALHSPSQEKRYRKKYTDTINKLIKDLNNEYQQSLKEKFGYTYRGRGIKSRYPDFIVPRKHPSAMYLQRRFFDLLQLQKVEQVKFSIQRYILEILGIERFGIILTETQKENEKFWLASNITEDLLESQHHTYLEKAREKKVPQYYTMDKIHYCVIPLVIKKEVIGLILSSDEGELPFTTQEKRIIELSSFYLTVILKKIGEYQEVLEQREHFSQLLTISREILQVMDLSELESKIVYHALELTTAERGFFITLDKSKNFVFMSALHRTGEKIDEQDFKISKSVLKEVYNQKKVVTTIDALDEPLLSDSESIKIYDIHSIYCAPLKVKNELFGFLYLDNLGSKKKTLPFDQRLMELFLLECETAIKNCLDYMALYNANAELVKLDEQRINFINMVSHEFRTPIQTLIGYVNILKDETISPKIKEKTLKIIERNLNRLTFAIKNMMQMSAIEQMSGQIVKEVVDVADVLKIVYEETKPFAEERKQKFILRTEKELKPIYVEHNSLINAIKNLVFNAIKFTDDYGEIVLGARNSRFKNEEIDNKPAIVIYVKDNGIGIPSYELENIFKEFYEVADIKSHHSGLSEFLSSGLGLGLPVSKSIVQLFGGKIWVESTKGEGSTFFVALPLAESQTKESANRGEK